MAWNCISVIAQQTLNIKRDKRFGVWEATIMRERVGVHKKREGNLQKDYKFKRIVNKINKTTRRMRMGKNIIPIEGIRLSVLFYTSILYRTHIHIANICRKSYHMTTEDAIVAVQKMNQE